MLEFFLGHCRYVFNHLNAEKSLTSLFTSENIPYRNICNTFQIVARWFIFFISLTKSESIAGYMPQLFSI